MGKKYVLVDDYDGKELPEDTQPVNLSLGRTTYAVYLSDENHGKLMEAIEPFIKDAETVSTSTAAVRGSASKSADKADKEKMKKVRVWARETGYKFPSATEKDEDGKPVMRTLGDRGRIPEEVVKAYEEANPDE